MGNHNLKYLHTIETFNHTLVERLETEGKSDRVHLWMSARNPKAEMDTVLACAQSGDEKLVLLGCYYALQFLHMVLRSIDVLKLDLTVSSDRVSVYKNFMLQVGDEFRALTASYIERLLDIFIAGERRPEFVILGVGTKSDQDDIDVGIVDDGSGKRQEFNRVIARVSNEMLKYSTRFHFHLSEHVGSESYSASIPEYQVLLDKEIRDFVIISEMLGAARITGSKSLLRQFQESVTNRYFFRATDDGRYHEGYLRGILGEVKSLLVRPVAPLRIHPKDDALRMIKGVITAKKTVFGIEKVGAWGIIDDLNVHDPKRICQYYELERSLTFFEIFRYLYQLYVVQEEEILLNDEETLKNLRFVAQTLGYRDIGSVNCVSHLVVHYYENLQRTKRVVLRLLEDLKDHLKQTTLFTGLLTAAKAGTYPGNFAMGFIRALRFFRGTTFWDDILERDRDHLERFARDLELLPGPRRQFMIRQFISGACYSPESLIAFLVLLAQNESTRPLFSEFNNILLTEMKKQALPPPAIAHVFSLSPKLFNDYLTIMDSSEQRACAESISDEVVDEEIKRVLAKVKRLCQLHQETGHYFKSFFRRIVNQYPECFRALDDNERLKEISLGIWGDVEMIKDFKKKQEKLGDYYDLEFLRVGLQTLKGAPVSVTNEEFTGFSDRYIQTLFDICRAEVDEEQGRVVTDDLLAVYAAGGHAREQAYDDDYDIIVLLNSTNEKVTGYARRIITKMNGELVKRGVLPHYRLAQHFGEYVVTVAELERFLVSGKQDIFIDMSQLLGARLVVGSSKFEESFEERIVTPHIYDKNNQYVKEMINELFLRHEEEVARGIPSLDIKEGLGGLRDIEMVMLIYKAKFKLRDPINSTLFATVAGIDARNSPSLHTLAQGFHFLKRLRDLYRLTAGAVDSLLPESLGPSAQIMGFSDEKKLLATYYETTRVVYDTITAVIESFTD